MKIEIDSESVTKLAILGVVVVGVGVGAVVVGMGSGGNGPTVGNGATPTNGSSGGPGTGTLSVQDSEVGVGSSTTTTLTLSRAPNGFAGFILNVTVGSDNAVITGGTVNSTLGLKKADVSEDGSRIFLRGVDLEDRVKPGDANIALATISVRGNNPGETNLSIEVTKIDPDEGEFDPAVRNGTVSVQG